jgi:predicted acyltransferase (DUF342 family)
LFIDDTEGGPANINLLGGTVFAPRIENGLSSLTLESRIALRSGDTGLDIDSSGLRIFSSTANAKLNVEIPLYVHKEIRQASEQIAANADFMTLIPNGQGGLRLDDQGNLRGPYSIDLQRVRQAPSQVASGTHSVLLGGHSSTASGLFSTVLNGYQCIASETMSYAAGAFAQAVHPYSFIMNFGVPIPSSMLSSTRRKTSALTQQVSSTASRQFIVNLKEGPFSFPADSGLFAIHADTFLQGNVTVMDGSVFTDRVGRVDHYIDFDDDGITLEGDTTMDNLKVTGTLEAENVNLPQNVEVTTLTFPNQARLQNTTAQVLQLDDGTGGPATLSTTSVVNETGALQVGTTTQGVNVPGDLTVGGTLTATNIALPENVTLDSIVFDVDNPDVRARRTDASTVTFDDNNTVSPGPAIVSTNQGAIRTRIVENGNRIIDMNNAGDIRITNPDAQIILDAAANGSEVVGDLNVTGTLTAGTFSPANIETATITNPNGVLTVGSVPDGATVPGDLSVNGTLTAGTFSPANIETATITNPNGVLTVGSVPDGATVPGDLSVNGTLTAGTFSPANIETATITNPNGVLTVGSVPDGATVPGDLSVNGTLTVGNFAQATVTTDAVVLDIDNADTILARNGAAGHAELKDNNDNPGTLQTGTVENVNGTDARRLVLTDGDNVRIENTLAGGKILLEKDTDVTGDLDVTGTLTVGNFAQATVTTDAVVLDIDNADTILARNGAAGHAELKDNNDNPGTLQTGTVENVNGADARRLVLTDGDNVRIENTLVGGKILLEKDTDVTGDLDVTGTLTVGNFAQATVTTDAVVLDIDNADTILARNGAAGHAELKDNNDNPGTLQTGTVENVNGTDARRLVLTDGDNVRIENTLAGGKILLEKDTDVTGDLDVTGTLTVGNFAQATVTTDAVVLDIDNADTILARNGAAGHAELKDNNDNPGTLQTGTVENVNGADARRLVLTDGDNVRIENTLAGGKILLEKDTDVTGDLDVTGTLTVGNFAQATVTTDAVVLDIDNADTILARNGAAGHAELKDNNDNPGTLQTGTVENVNGADARRLVLTDGDNVRIENTLAGGKILLEKDTDVTGDLDVTGTLTVGNFAQATVTTDAVVLDIDNADTILARNGAAGHAELKDNNDNPGTLQTGTVENVNGTDARRLVLTDGDNVRIENTLVGGKILLEKDTDVTGDLDVTGTLTVGNFAQATVTTDAVVLDIDNADTILARNGAAGHAELKDNNDNPGTLQTGTVENVNGTDARRLVLTDGDNVRIENTLVGGKILLEKDTDVTGDLNVTGTITGTILQSTVTTDAVILDIDNADTILARNGAAGHAELKDNNDNPGTLQTGTVENVNGADARRLVLTDGDNVRIENTLVGGKILLEKDTDVTGDLDVTGTLTVGNFAQATVTTDAVVFDIDNADTILARNGVAGHAELKDNNDNPGTLQTGTVENVNGADARRLVLTDGDNVRIENTLVGGKILLEKDTDVTGDLDVTGTLTVGNFAQATVTTDAVVFDIDNADTILARNGAAGHAELKDNNDNPGTLQTGTVENVDGTDARRLVLTDGDNVRIENTLVGGKILLEKDTDVTGDLDVTGTLTVGNFAQATVTTDAVVLDIDNADTILARNGAAGHAELKDNNDNPGTLQTGTVENVNGTDARRLVLTDGDNVRIENTLAGGKILLEKDTDVTGDLDVTGTLTVGNFAQATVTTDAVVLDIDNADTILARNGAAGHAELKDNNDNPGTLQTGTVENVNGTDARRLVLTDGDNVRIENTLAGGKILLEKDTDVTGDLDVTGTLTVGNFAQATVTTDAVVLDIDNADTILARNGAAGHAELKDNNDNPGTLQTGTIENVNGADARRLVLTDGDNVRIENTLVGGKILLEKDTDVTGDLDVTGTLTVGNFTQATVTTDAVVLDIAEQDIRLQRMDTSTLQLDNNAGGPATFSTTGGTVQTRRVRQDGRMIDLSAGLSNRIDIVNPDGNILIQTTTTTTADIQLQPERDVRIGTGKRLTWNNDSTGNQIFLNGGQVISTTINLQDDRFLRYESDDNRLKLRTINETIELLTTGTDTDVMLNPQRNIVVTKPIISDGGAITVSSEQLRLGTNADTLHDGTLVFNAGMSATTSAIRQLVFNLRNTAYTPPATQETLFINGDVHVEGAVTGATDLTTNTINMDFVRLQSETPNILSLDDGGGGNAVLMTSQIRYTDVNGDRIINMAHEAPPERHNIFIHNPTPNGDVRIQATRLNLQTGMSLTFTASSINNWVNTNGGTVFMARANYLHGRLIQFNETENRFEIVAPELIHIESTTAQNVTIRGQNNVRLISQRIGLGPNATSAFDGTFVFNSIAQAETSALRQAIFNLRDTAYTPPADEETLFMNSDLQVNGNLRVTGDLIADIPRWADNTAFVDVQYGDNGTAQLNDAALPFATLGAAIAAILPQSPSATSPWLVLMRPGITTEPRVQLAGHIHISGEGPNLSIIANGVTTSANVASGDTVRLANLTIRGEQSPNTTMAALRIVNEGVTIEAFNVIFSHVAQQEQSTSRGLVFVSREAHFFASACTFRFTFPSLAIASEFNCILLVDTLALHPNIHIKFINNTFLLSHLGGNGPVSFMVFQNAASIQVLTQNNYGVLQTNATLGQRICYTNVVSNVSGRMWSKGDQFVVRTLSGGSVSTATYEGFRITAVPQNTSCFIQVINFTTQFEPSNITPGNVYAGFVGRAGSNGLPVLQMLSSTFVGVPTPPLIGRSGQDVIGLTSNINACLVDDAVPSVPANFEWRSSGLTVNNRSSEIGASAEFFILDSDVAYLHTQTGSGETVLRLPDALQNTGRVVYVTGHATVVGAIIHIGVTTATDTINGESVPANGFPIVEHSSTPFQSSKTFTFLSYGNDGWYVRL